MKSLKKNKGTDLSREVCPSGQKKQMKKLVDSEIQCSCGAIFYFKSSREKMNIEICSQCHPVYVGKKKIIDAMGRVQRFQKRVAAKKNQKRSLCGVVATTRSRNHYVKSPTRQNATGKKQKNRLKIQK